MDTHHDAHQAGTTETAGTSRRRLIAALLAGGAGLAVAGVVSGEARAEGVGPTRDPADNDALNAALEREARMTATYLGVVGATGNSDDKAAMKLIHDHHLAYVDALRAILGPEEKDADTSALLPATSSAAELAALEEATIEIHLGVLAGLKGTSAASLIASIVAVEARHAAALALVAGDSPTAAAGL